MGGRGCGCLGPPTCRRTPSLRFSHLEGELREEGHLWSWRGRESGIVEGVGVGLDDRPVSGTYHVPFLFTDPVGPPGASAVDEETRFVLPTSLLALDRCDRSCPCPSCDPTR